MATYIYTLEKLEEIHVLYHSLLNTKMDPFPPLPIRTVSSRYVVCNLTLLSPPYANFNDPSSKRGATKVTSTHFSSKACRRPVINKTSIIHCSFHKARPNFQTTTWAFHACVNNTQKHTYLKFTTAPVILVGCLFNKIPRSHTKWNILFRLSTRRITKKNNPLKRKLLGGREKVKGADSQLTFQADLPRN